MCNNRTGSANADSVSWYAIRTFNSQELKVSKYLDARMLKNFVPMRKFRVSDNGKPVWKSRPIVHNLIFVMKMYPQDVIEHILSECPFPIKIYRRGNDARSWYEIDNREMLDLRMICDNSFCEPHFLPTDEIKDGDMVRVVHGPLAGIRGKMVRKNKKYYIVKSLGDLSVEVIVSRWCCEPDEGSEEE